MTWLQITISDLHAAEARYHTKCSDSFMPRTNVAATSRWEEHSTIKDPIFPNVIREMQDNTQRIWTSTEIHKI